MAQSVYPSSPSSSPRNATSQLFSTYQATGTYTYNGTLAAGKYAVVADAVQDGVGTYSTTASYVATGSSGTLAGFANNGTPLYFYTSTSTTFSITGGTVATTIYPYATASASKPISSNTGQSVANITTSPATGGSGYILLKNGQSISYSNTNGVISVSPSGAPGSGAINSSIITSQGQTNQIFAGNQYAAGVQGPTIAYGNGLIAVWSGVGSYLNTLFVSADGGASWTTRTMPVSPQYASSSQSIFYLNSLWVATIYNGSNFYIYTSTDTITWTQRYTLASPVAIYSGTYGTKYVLGLSGTGGSNNIIVSTDAVTWTLGSIPNTYQIIGLAWNGTRYVASGYQSGLASTTWLYNSTDAITWTSATAASSYGVTNIIWNGTYFVTQEASSYIMIKSTDGITWSTATNPLGTSYIFNFALIGTMFYAINGNSSGASYLYGSTDGTTWTLMSNGIGSYLPTNGSSNSSFLRVIAAGSYLYYFFQSSYATSQSFTTVLPITSIGVKMYVNGTSFGSIVGITPPVISSGFGFYDGFLVQSGTILSYLSTPSTNSWTNYGYYSSGMPICVYESGASTFYYLNIYSTSYFAQYSNAGGQTFATGASGTWYAATWANGLYLYGGASGALYTLSAAAGPSAFSSATFTSRTSGFGTYAIRAIAYGNGLYIIGGDNGSLSTSTDGITWTSRTSGFGTTTIRAITGKPQTNGQWLFAAGGDNGTLSTSTDGITWTTRSSGTTANLTASNPFTSIYTNYPLVFGGTSNTVIYSNADGSVWTKVNTTINPYVASAYYDASSSQYSAAWTFVASTYTSSVPVSWVISGSSTPASTELQSLNINSVAYGNSLYLAAGINGQMYTSTDTITWTQRSIAGTTESITAVNYLNATYVAGTLDGNIYTSTDGTSWTLRTSNIAAGNQINYLGYLNGKYYAGYSNHLSKTSSSNEYTSNPGLSNYGYNSGVQSQQYSAWSNFRSTDFYSGGIQTSTDLITWTAVTANTIGGFTGINSMAYAGSTYLTANGGGSNTLGSGNNYYTNSGAANSQLYYSAALTSYYINYALSVLGVSGAGFVDVAYNNGYICAIINSTTNNIYVTTDNNTWTTYSASITNAPSSQLYMQFYNQNTSFNNNIYVAGGLVSVTPGPGSTFIITTNSRLGTQSYYLNPAIGSLTLISMPAESGPLSVYKHNTAFNPTNGTVLFATKTGKLASGTITTTTTNTYYPSIFSLYSVNA
jgi:hypothetical protein